MSKIKLEYNPARPRLSVDIDRELVWKAREKALKSHKSLKQYVTDLILKDLKNGM